MLEAPYWGFLRWLPAQWPVLCSEKGHLTPQTPPGTQLWFQGSGCAPRGRGQGALVMKRSVWAAPPPQAQSPTPSHLPPLLSSLQSAGCRMEKGEAWVAAPRWPPGTWGWSPRCPNSATERCPTWSHVPSRSPNKHGPTGGHTSSLVPGKRLLPQVHHGFCWGGGQAAGFSRPLGPRRWVWGWSRLWGLSFPWMARSINIWYCRPAGSMPRAASSAAQWDSPPGQGLQKPVSVSWFSGIRL